MKIGLLKSKIEKQLIESFKKESLKNNMFIFKELVLENKNLSKLLFLYDNLSQRKHLSESTAIDLINQSIVIYENTINKLSKKELNELNLWIGHIRTNNEYSDLDNLFSNNILTLEDKVKSKSTILENLKKEPSKVEPKINIPLNLVIESANKTVKEFINTLEDTSKKVLLKILKEDEDKLQVKYEILKETTVEKLEELKDNESDSEVVRTINETIQKLETETFDRISYFKLFELNRNI
jgi:hypothetical protein